jgi:hypothetical protein
VLLSSLEGIQVVAFTSVSGTSVLELKESGVAISRGLVDPKRPMIQCLDANPPRVGMARLRRLWSGTTSASLQREVEHSRQPCGYERVLGCAGASKMRRLVIRNGECVRLGSPELQASAEQQPSADKLGKSSPFRVVQRRSATRSS